MSDTTNSELLKRIEQLEAKLAGQGEPPEEQRTSRRGMLRLAGAAAVGGLAAAITSEPVAATDGLAVLAGVSGNTATLPTGIAVAPGTTDYGLGCYETGLGALPPVVGRPAVLGHATDTAFNTGVAGIDAADSFGYGVVGLTQIGWAVYGEAQGAGGVGLVGYGPAGALRLLITEESSPPPTRATSHGFRTFEADFNNDVWFCYEGGAPGKWRKLAGPGTAGAFHAIKPKRVYDSRFEVPSLLASGSNRTISVADEKAFGVVVTANVVPDGATAVAANVTVTGTIGGFGYLSCNPGGDLVAGASTINWTASGQTIANGVSLTLNGNRELTVICDGGGSTQFIVDIAGYYL